MYNYSVAVWIMLFFIYGFLGWIFESAYVSIRKRKIINRGFLKGPMLPIYAFGAIMMLFATIPFEGSLAATYFAGMIAATALEFVVGVTMENIFKVKYWDYSNQKFQFKGVICLSSSIAWGFFTLLLTEVIHKPIEKMLFLIPNMIKYVLVVVLEIIFLVDTILSVNVALDLRQMLEKMTAMKKELEELQEQFAEYANEWKEGIKKTADEQREKLEEQKELLGERWIEQRGKLEWRLEGQREKLEECLEERREKLEERLEEQREKLEERLEGQRERLEERLGERIGEKKEKLEDLLEEQWEELLENAPEKLAIYKKLKGKFAEYKAYSKGYGLLKAQLFKANPTVSSKKYKEALKDVMEAIDEGIQAKKENIKQKMKKKNED